MCRAAETLALFLCRAVEANVAEAEILSRLRGRLETESDMDMSLRDIE